MSKRAKQKLNIISIPERYSEFEIQAELFWKFKQSGVTVRGEVQALTTYCDRFSKCRMDIVVFNKLGQAVAIVECKDKKYEDGKNGLLYERINRQCEKYSQFGIPVFQCLGMDSVDHVFEEIMQFVDSCPFA